MQDWNSLSTLPAWAFHRTRNIGLLNNGRFRTVMAAAVCLLLGYSTVSFMGSTGHQLDPQSAGGSGPDAVILYGPELYGGLTNEPAEDRDGEDSRPQNDGDGRSISNALKGLHYAVSDKLASWKPWSSGYGAKHNHTSNPRPSGIEVENKAISSGLTEELIRPDRDSLGHRARIGKCTIVLYGSKMYERTVRTHESHDRMHGYPLHVLRQSLMDDVWSKPAYILSLLLRELAKPEAERLEWLLWVDADTVMLNPYVPIEMFLPPSPEFDDVHLLVTHDWNGLNNGVFPVRICQWAVDLFAAIVAFRHYKPDTSLTFRDQSAMDMLLQDKKFAAHTVEAPQRWFNAYQGEVNETIAPFQVRRGDFLVHFAGVINRDERLLYWLDRAEQHLPDWEVEVQHTSYPTEVKEFWAQKSNEHKSKVSQMIELRTKANELLMKVDARMADYEDRLQQSDVSSIRNNEAVLKKALETDEKDLNLDVLGAAFDSLDQAATPLDLTIDGVRKVLMKEAHNAIFDAEKDLIANSGVSDPEISDIEVKAATLKNLVIQPHWQKHDMISAVEELKHARLRLQEKLSELEASSRRIQEAEASDPGQSSATGADVQAPK